MVGNELPSVLTAASTAAVPVEERSSLSAGVFIAAAGVLAWTSAGRPSRRRNTSAERRTVHVPHRTIPVPDEAASLPLDEHPLPVASETAQTDNAFAASSTTVLYPVESEPSAIHFQSPTRRSLMKPLAWLSAACLLLGSLLFSAGPVPTEQTAVASPADAAAESIAPSNTQAEYLTRNIEDIQPGDYVLAREEHGDKIALRRVVEVYRRTSHHLRHLTFESADGTTQTIQTTDEHPFWSVTESAWIEAGSLQPGARVTSPDGQLQTLATTRRTDHPEGVPVFNFQVEGWHTYYVSASPDDSAFLVHNADGYVDVSSLFGRQGRAEFTPNKIKRLTKDMKQNGFDPDSPIEIAVVDGRNIIIDGHHRARAAGAAGISDVPVIVREVSQKEGAALLQQAIDAAENLGLKSP